jgi:group II intron reverse transcriptase/maturase
VLWQCRHGYPVVLDADIRGFFDRIPHHVIMAAVAAEVADGTILRLVKRFLKSGVMEDGVFKPTTVGTPQGGVLSPLLANIVLHALDWRLHEAGYRFVRYADDFVVPCPSHARAKEARALVERTLADLGLELNQDKTTVVHFGKGFPFLGFRLSSRAVTVRPQSVEKFKTNVKGLTVRKHNLDAEAVMKLNRVIRGTAAYFAAPFSDCAWQFRNLDAFVRRRLRSMKFKRISRLDNVRMRDRHFRRLGLLSLLAFCSS